MRIRSPFNRFARGEDGAQAVEFAIIAPVLLAFLFGTFEIGRVMFAESKVAEAASDGARLATVYAKSSASYSSTETSDVTDAVKDNFEAAKRSLVHVSLSDTTFGGQSFVKIDVTYNFTFLVKLTPRFSGVTISTTRYAPVI